MKKEANITVIIITILSALCLWWMCAAYSNTYDTHVVKPKVNSKNKYVYKHRHKHHHYIDTIYDMNVTSKLYGTANLHVDDITYYNHIVGDTLTFEWTNHELSRFDEVYDKGLFMHFFVSVCVSIMFWCLAYSPLKRCQSIYNKEL